MAPKHWRNLWLIGLAALIVSLGGGVGVAHAQKIKIGVVDLQKVLDESARGKSAKDRLKVVGEKLQQEIQGKKSFKDQKEEELQKMRSEIGSKGLVLNDQARIAKEEEFRNKARELKRFIDDTNNFIEDATREFREKELRETQLLLVAIRKIVRDIGKDDGYTVILEGNDNATVVLYAEAPIDITSKVIQRFDQSSAKR